jgi:hypothetical protein
MVTLMLTTSIEICVAGPARARRGAVGGAPARGPGIEEVVSRTMLARGADETKKGRGGIGETMKTTKKIDGGGKGSNNRATEATAEATQQAKAKAKAKARRAARAGGTRSTPPRTQPTKGE